MQKYCMIVTGVKLCEEEEENTINAAQLTERRVRRRQADWQPIQPGQADVRPRHSDRQAAMMTFARGQEVASITKSQKHKTYAYIVW